MPQTIFKSILTTSSFSQAEARAWAGGEGIWDGDEVSLGRQLPEAEERPESGQPRVQHRGQLVPRVLAQTEAAGHYSNRWHQSEVISLTADYL